MKSANDDSGIAVRWWRALQTYFPDGTPNPHADRAALARLRRADLAGAMQDPATFALFHTLGCTHPDDLPTVALCAAVLPGVREDDRRVHTARQLGAPPGDPAARPVLSPLRFRRLIEADGEEERLISFRRALALAGGALNVRELAAACLDWSEFRRRRWIFEYYAARFAAPSDEPTNKDARS
jgi:CRISPR system Cascade subunit CasB